MINAAQTVRRQFGLSLVELLVAMVISVFVIGGVAQIFISIKRYNSLLIAETALQENARFAFSFITRIVEKSAGLGCTSPSDTNVTSLLDFTEKTFRPAVGIEGWEADRTNYGSVFVPDTVPQLSPASHWSGSTGTALDDDIQSIGKSDILSIWYTADNAGALTSVTADDLQFAEIQIEQGDVIVINDCKTITFAQACQCDTSDAVACELLGQARNRGDVPYLLFQSLVLLLLISKAHRLPCKSPA